jgi:hypothetical protein
LERKFQLWNGPDPMQQYWATILNRPEAHPHLVTVPLRAWPGPRPRRRACPCHPPPGLATHGMRHPHVLTVHHPYLLLDPSVEVSCLSSPRYLVPHPPFLCSMPRHPTVPANAGAALLPTVETTTLMRHSDHSRAALRLRLRHT